MFKSLRFVRSPQVRVFDTLSGKRLMLLTLSAVVNVSFV